MHDALFSTLIGTQFGTLFGTLFCATGSSLMGT